MTYRNLKLKKNDIKKGQKLGEKKQDDSGKQCKEKAESSTDELLKYNDAPLACDLITDSFDLPVF